MEAGGGGGAEKRDIRHLGNLLAIHPASCSLVGGARSRHSNIKGGHMIVHQNSNLPLSTVFFKEKETLILLKH